MRERVRRRGGEREIETRVSGERERKREHVMYLVIVHVWHTYLLCIFDRRTMSEKGQRKRPDKRHSQVRDRSRDRGDFQEVHTHTLIPTRTHTILCACVCFCDTHECIECTHVHP